MRALDSLTSIREMTQVLLISCVVCYFCALGIVSQRLNLCKTGIIFGDKEADGQN